MLQRINRECLYIISCYISCYGGIMLEINAIDRTYETIKDEYSIQEEQKYNKKIIINDNVFSSNYKPKNIFFRDTEIETLFRKYIPTQKQKYVPDLSIYGVTGTGKTLITNLVFEKLSKETDNTYYIFVQCNELTTKPAIVKHILNQITDIENSSSITDNLAKIKKMIDGKLMVLIMDEVDLFLKNDKSNENLIQIFSDWVNTVMVFVSNDPSWHRFIMDHRTISRLHRTNMIFRPYTADEIFQILQDRAFAGIREGAISDEMINEISRFTSQYNGDARIGVKLLSKAAELAEMKGKTQIDIEVIKEAIEQLEDDNKISFIKTLPPQHQLLLVSLFLAHQKLGITDFEKVYNEYINLAQHSTSFKKLTKNTVQIYINELHTYNLIKKQFGKGRGRGKGRESTLLFPDFDIDKFQNEIINSITI